jgi:hypothetical protein
VRGLYDEPAPWRNLPYQNERGRNYQGTYLGNIIIGVEQS